jgi:hypothetical protein
MSQHGNLEERYILLVGASVGLRASDFIEFTYGQFRSLNLDSEAPIPIGEIGTQKEHIKAYPFLTSDAVAIIKLILEKNREAKDSDRILTFKDEQPLTLALHRMFSNASIVSGNKIVRFHNLRKYLIDRLSAVASESQWKQIVGKAIHESAYVSTEQLREVYSKAMPLLVINGNSRNSKLEETVETLTQQIDKLTSENMMYKGVLLELVKSKTEETRVPVSTTEHYSPIVSKKWIEIQKKLES